MPYRFRFSIGQVMGVIALSALLMANAIFITQGNFTFYSVLVAAILVRWTRRPSLQSSALTMDVGLDRRSIGSTARDDRTGVAKSAV